MFVLRADRILSGWLYRRGSTYYHYLTTVEYAGRTRTFYFPKVRITQNLTPDGPQQTFEWGTPSSLAVPRARQEESGMYELPAMTGERNPYAY